MTPAASVATTIHAHYRAKIIGSIRAPVSPGLRRVRIESRNGCRLPILRPRQDQGDISPPFAVLASPLGLGLATEARDLEQVESRIDFLLLV